MLRSVYLFLVVFVLSFVIQSFIWQVDTFTDEGVWLERARHLASDLKNQTREFNQSDYGGHPGMAGVALTALLHRTGLSLITSMRLSVALINSAMIAGIGVVSYRLRPDTLWWLGAISIVAFHPFYIHASPTNAVIAPAIVLMFLLVLWLYEHPDTTGKSPAVLLGIVIGAALATRFTDSLLLGGMLLFFLALSHGIRPVILMSGAALATSILLNPLMWFAPLEHLTYIFSRAELHLNQILLHNLTWVDFVQFTPLALISIALALVLLFLKEKIKPSPVPLPFIGLMLAATIVTTAILLWAKSHSLRYYGPLIFTWEAFLPLWLLHLLRSISFETESVQQRKLMSTVLKVAVIVLLAGGQLLLLLYSLFVPVGVHV